MATLGQRLRRRAEEIGMTNAEVARSAGISEQRYGNYVTDTREPDLGTLVRIAKALRTTLDVLAGLGERAGASDKRRQRLTLAAENLPDDVIDVVTVQLEALALRGKPFPIKATRRTK